MEMKRNVMEMKQLSSSRRRRRRGGEGCMYVCQEAAGERSKRCKQMSLEVENKV